MLHSLGKNFKISCIIAKHDSRPGYNAVCLYGTGGPRYNEVVLYAGTKDDWNSLSVWGVWYKEYQHIRNGADFDQKYRSRDVFTHKHRTGLADLPLF